VLLSEIKENDIRFLALNWFRDSEETDQTVYSGFSIGLTLMPTIWTGLTSIVNYYLRFQYEYDQHGVLTLPVDATRLQKTVAQKLGYDIKYTAAHGLFDYDEYLPQLWQLPTHWLSGSIRFVQDVFIRNVPRKKRIFIADHTTRKLAYKQTQTLTLFRKSVFRGAFTKKSKAYFRHYEASIPKALLSSIDIDYFKIALAKINAVWPEELIELCCDYIAMVYADSQKAIASVGAIWAEFLDHYQPHDVSMPSDNFFDTIVLYQMCNLRGINTSCYLDGYNLLPISPPHKTSDGRDWLAGTIYAYGTASAKIYVLQGYPCERINIIDPPFLDNFKSIVLKDRYDFVVMTLLPCTLNVSTNYLSPRDSLREILICLRKLGITRIAIKLKVEAERHYVQSVLDELNVKADILLGKFNKVLGKTNAVIGGISTAVAESAFVGIPYFVYEPLENGYSDEWLNSSVVISRDSIARNCEELRNLVLEKKPSFCVSIDELVVSNVTKY
jgi:hypothetical protein